MCIGCLAGTLGTTALAQQPVYSMEAVAVNSIPCSDVPVTHVKARPGDVLTLEVFLRDWSPAGDRLNAYQMQLEPMDFRSGLAGSIKPNQVWRMPVKRSTGSTGNSRPSER